MAKLSQITSESEVLREMLDKLENPPLTDILQQINEFLDRIKDVKLSLKIEDIKGIIKKINNTKDLKKIINYLNRFENIVDIVVENNTFEWMRKRNLLDKSVKNEPLKIINGIPKNLNIKKLRNFVHKSWKSDKKHII